MSWLIRDALIVPPLREAPFDGRVYARTRIEAAQIGFDDGFIYGEVAQAPELRKIPHLRLITDGAQVAFTEWAASPQKIRY